MRSSIVLMLVGAFFLQLPAAAQAAECAGDVPRRYCEHPWFAANRLSLDMIDERKRFKASWQFEVADNGDLRVIKDETTGSEKVDGEVMIIAGERMLARGFEVQEGVELRAVDGPVLAMQLALRLLESAFPQGPASVQSSAEIAFRSERDALVLATPSADGGFPAPWAVRGTAERVDAKAVRFDMVFEGAMRAEEGMTNYRIPLKGTWRRESPAPRFEDSMSLEGWSIHRVSVSSSEDKGQYRTLGDLRAALGAR